ncbi:lymphatic vessel endothelial hyaluronic receptor 1b [Thunnus albacares]|uniref:lymphatic vessel endothelial hyaluronic receptor 1b n=1 Tax=Thunnus albacares TaxID=8236 RepID=UPI001CF6D034|nr:lymphatic vessel endothelial hyaluronic receptor 1b [Thunnus albacares]
MLNMARFLLFTQFLLPTSFAVFSLASGSSLIKAVPTSQRAAGVFMLIEGGKYTFNFTAAKAACLSLNVTIATRTQIERAVQRGLEMCKFGWIDGQVAVIPRITADKNCGKGKTGVVLWYARADQKFGVFCFNASDLEESPKTSTASPQTSSFSKSLVALTQTSRSAATPLLRLTTKSPSSRKPKTTESPQHIPLTSSFTLLFMTTPSTGFSPTSPPLKPVSTHTSTSLSNLITSSPAVTNFASSTSVHAANFSVSSESVPLQTVSSAKPSLGAVTIVIIILGIILLILTAAGAVWYYKLSIFHCRSQGQQKDDIETEMWKHTDSELDLHGQQGAEEEDDGEETDRKYSSDVMLFVNPDVKTNSVE